MRVGGGRFKRFNKLSWREKHLFLESLVLQIWIGLLLKVIPFRRIPRIFSNQQFEYPTQEETQSRTPSVGTSINSPQSKDIELIRVAIQKAGMVSPWRNRCLVSSLAARCMLRRRKIHSQLSLGVAKAAGGNVIAHAWLTAGEAEIVPKGVDYQQLYLF